MNIEKKISLVKKKVSHIICERNLCSYMNNTKWSELIIAIRNEMPFPPPFSIKYVTQNIDIQDELEKGDVYYLGDWEGEEFPAQEYYFNIEWIKIRPCYLKSKGKFVEPEKIDGTNKFEEILHKYSIKYELKEGLYCIYGYR